MHASIPPVRLVFPENGFTRLRAALIDQAPREATAVLLCHTHISNTSTRLLVHEVVYPTADDYQAQSEMRAQLSPMFVAEVLRKARESAQSLIFVHTHPFSDYPEFSEVDDRGENALKPALFGRAPGGHHGALVLGTAGFRGHVYIRAGKGRAEIGEILQVGKTVEYFSPKRASALSVDTAKDLYHRNVLALGSLGQERLKKLRVGLVGLGGTGSVVAQCLAYLGVGSMVLIDFDKIGPSNLNRLVGATQRDIGKYKTKVIGKYIETVSPATEAKALVGDVMQAGIAKALLKCDLIFSCTDTHGSRAVLNQLAYQYLIPVIDMGVRIDARDSNIVAMAGRVQLLSPGLPCLVCQNVLDSEAVRRDFLTPEQRNADPYIVGHHEPQPSIVSINTTISSLAVTMLLGVVVGLPTHARHLVYLIDQGNVRPATGVQNSTCIVCSERGALGRGDAGSMPWHDS